MDKHKGTKSFNHNFYESPTIMEKHMDTNNYYESPKIFHEITHGHQELALIKTLHPHCYLLLPAAGTCNGKASRQTASVWAYMTNTR